MTGWPNAARVSARDRSLAIWTALEESIEANEDSVQNLDDLLNPPESESTPTETTTSVTQPPSSDPVDQSTTTTSTSTTTTTTTLPADPIDFLAIGDSVMLGAADELTSRGYYVDAKVSRQLSDIVPPVEQLVAADLISDTPVTIHLGTNGPIDDAELDELLDALSGFKNVLLLNVRANRSWTGGNNALIAAADARPNVIVIDWANKSNECVGNCFASDGIHLSADGVQFYANMIREVTGR